MGTQWDFAKLKKRGPKIGSGNTNDKKEKLLEKYEDSRLLGLWTEGNVIRGPLLLWNQREGETAKRRARSLPSQLTKKGPRSSQRGFILSQWKESKGQAGSTQEPEIVRTPLQVVEKRRSLGSGVEKHMVFWEKTTRVVKKGAETD